MSSLFPVTWTDGYQSESNLSGYICETAVKERTSFSKLTAVAKEVIHVNDSQSIMIKIITLHVTIIRMQPAQSNYLPWAANMSSCAVVSRKLLEHRNNVWTTLTACGALTVWQHGNYSLQQHFKHTLSMTPLLQCTLPDTNRVSVRVSLLASCAHSSSDQKNWLLTCPSPYGSPQTNADPMQTINEK